MASHASAVKAHRQSLRHQQRNREQRSRLRTQLKAIRSSQAKGEQAAAQLREAISLIDRMAGKGIIHKNAGARYKSRLMTRIGE